jgi:hypothetical protein
VEDKGQQIFDAEYYEETEAKGNYLYGEEL